jgi:hypothetical protein
MPFESCEAGQLRECGVVQSLPQTPAQHHISDQDGSQMAPFRLERVGAPSSGLVDSKNLQEPLLSPPTRIASALVPQRMALSSRLVLELQA